MKVCSGADCRVFAIIFHYFVKKIKNCAKVLKTYSTKGKLRLLNKGLKITRKGKKSWRGNLRKNKIKSVKLYLKDHQRENLHPRSSIRVLSLQLRKKIIKEHQLKNQD